MCFSITSQPIRGARAPTKIAEIDMGIASSLTALGLHRRLPYLLRLRAWIDQTYVEIGRRVALQDFVFGGGS